MNHGGGRGTRKHWATREDLLLLTTMLVEKSEDIVGPDGGSKVTERVAVLRRVPIGGIDLHLVRFPRVLHHCGEDLARRQVIIVLGLEKNIGACAFRTEAVINDCCAGASAQLWAPPAESMAAQ